MRPDPLSEALREAPIPLRHEAERRGQEVVEAAYAERQPQRRPGLPRLAIALSTATLLVALLLSPAGAAVRDWVDEAITSSAPRPEPALSEVPGGGRLLVQSASGPWVVKPDGSRRLLGDYREATWSPRGLFVAVAADRTLSAVEPDGTPRWSISTPGRIADPRWSPSGYRIAYRSGARLWVVAGDGSGETELAAATAPVAPAWSPIGAPQLAYVGVDGKLRIADSESGKVLDSTAGLPGVTKVEWGAGGAAILEASSSALRLRFARNLKLATRPTVNLGIHLPVPRGEQVVDATLSPRGRSVAAVVAHTGAGAHRSSVLLFDPDQAEPRRLLTVPGALGEVLWSPDGRRLLISWPDADQWLFLPVGRGKGRAVSGISAAFAPGTPTAPFPRVAGWCCRR